MEQFSSYAVKFRSDIYSLYRLLRGLDENYRPQLLPGKHPDRNLTKYLKTLRQEKNDRCPTLLLEMLETYQDQAKHLTSYWQYLAIRNIEQLITFGFDAFKQTIGKNYFLFTNLASCSNVIDRRQDGLANSGIGEFCAKHNHLSFTESFQLNILTHSLREQYRERFPGDLSIEEPLSGGPAYLTIDGCRVTTDLITSLYEYSTIAQTIDFENINVVVEVGGGYGRTAYAILKHQPKLRYFVCDVPPALFIAYEYLRDCFPEKRSCLIMDLEKISNVEELLDKNDLIFIFPEALDRLKIECDLFLAIDCLHEMPKKQILHLLDYATCFSDYLYYKCWKDTVIPFDKIRLQEDFYSKDRAWKRLLHEDCDWPDGFFHALYATK